jgi:hypothetical protein
MDEINFCDTAFGVELMIESKHNVYIIRTLDNKIMQKLHQLQPVFKFSNSILAKRLENFYEIIKEDINSFIDAKLKKDTESYNRLFWVIKDKIELEAKGELK